MGEQKHLKRVREYIKKSPVVTASSIKRIIKEKKDVKEYSKQLIRNLVRKGELKKLARGCYTKHEDPSLAVLCYKTAYLGLQDALSFHNLWEQETIPVIITATKPRPGLREVNGMNIMIKRIKKEYFFGYNYYEQESFYLPYSDIEKTLIDMIYFKQNISRQVKENLTKKINKKKLESYLQKYPEGLRKKVKRLINTD